MSKKRKQDPSEFKAKVALDAIKNEETISELGQRYGVHPNMINTWKRALLDGASDVYDKGRKSLKKQNAEPANGRSFWFKAGPIGAKCRLLDINRSRIYYRSRGIKPDDLKLMRLIDEQYMKTPFSGNRSMAKHLRRLLKRRINRKRIQWLMCIMGLEVFSRNLKISVSVPEKF